MVEATPGTRMLREFVRSMRCTGQVLILRPPRCGRGALLLSYRCVSSFRLRVPASEAPRRPASPNASVVLRGADPRASCMSSRRSTAELQDRVDPRCGSF